MAKKKSKVKTTDTRTQFEVYEFMALQGRYAKEGMEFVSPLNGDVIAEAVRDREHDGLCVSVDQSYAITLSTLKEMAVWLEALNKPATLFTRD